MSHVMWKKAYDVKATDGPFRMFIAEHDDGVFCIGVLHFNRIPIDDLNTRIQMELQTFIDTSEESVMKAARMWIFGKWGSSTEISEANYII